MTRLIEHFCPLQDLSTNDPYDVWISRPGQLARGLYHKSPALGAGPAVALTGLDFVLDAVHPRIYQRREYPIVRAHAALALLELSLAGQGTVFLGPVVEHLRWLSEHALEGPSWTAWGVGFPFSVDARLAYPADTPFTTVSIYPLEAFCRYRSLTGDTAFDPVIERAGRFFLEGITVMEEDDDAMATSYGPRADRVVTNAISYTMFAHALVLEMQAGRERERLAERIRKLYGFIRREQRADGSFLYSPRGTSFIDCFHTCIVLKNLIKTAALVLLDGSGEVVERGYAFLKESMFDAGAGLFRRFAVSRRPSPVAFDLYDNAEALGVAVLLGDLEFARRLGDAVAARFVEGMDVFSQVSILGHRMRKNTLRWAVMPYMNALALLERAVAKESGAVRAGSAGG